MEKIRNLMVDTNDGRKVPLNYVAEVVSAMGPNTINRENVKRKIVISANVADRDLRSVVNDIQKRIDTSIQLPKAITSNTADSLKANKPPAGHWR